MFGDFLCWGDWFGDLVWRLWVVIYCVAARFVVAHAGFVWLVYVFVECC